MRIPRLFSILLHIFLAGFDKNGQSDAMQNKKHIADKAAKHTYGVEIASREIIRVDANTRAQAAARARKAGLVVRSVNMLG